MLGKTFHRICDACGNLGSDCASSRDSLRWARANGWSRETIIDRETYLQGIEYDVPRVMDLCPPCRNEVRPWPRKAAFWKVAAVQTLSHGRSTFALCRFLSEREARAALAELVKRGYDASTIEEVTP